MLHRKLFIWDWNGTLQDDLDHIFECGVERIFRVFQRECPSKDQYRNQVTSDFMKSFYWPNGIPREVTAEQLDTIMKEGFVAKGQPADLFPGAAGLVREIAVAGHIQAVVSAYNVDKLKEAVTCSGLAEHFALVVGEARDGKAAVFRGLMEGLGFSPQMTVALGDMVQDAEAALAVGAAAVLVPHGFHSLDRMIRELGDQNWILCRRLAGVSRLI